MVLTSGVSLSHHGRHLLSKLLTASKEVNRRN